MAEIHIINEFIQDHGRDLKDNELLPMLVAIYNELIKYWTYIRLNDEMFAKKVPDNITKGQIHNEMITLRERASAYIDYFKGELGIPKEKLKLDNDGEIQEIVVASKRNGGGVTYVKPGKIKKVESPQDLISRILASSSDEEEEDPVIGEPINTELIQDELDYAEPELVSYDEIEYEYESDGDY